MSIKAALFAILSGDAAVAALAGTRIYPGKAATRPAEAYIVYRRISGARVHAFSGAVGLAHPRFQFDCWSGDPDQAEALAEAVRAVLNPFRGTAGGTKIRGVTLSTETDFYDQAAGLHRVSLDFHIWHEET